MSPTSIYQAAFFDGEFFGYADFIERADDGWLVCDAKLARSAKPKALLQLGAYADQIQRMDLPLSSRVSLLLGNGERADFRVADVHAGLPRAPRHGCVTCSPRTKPEACPSRGATTAIVACGKCDECKHAATATNDVILVSPGCGWSSAASCAAAEHHHDRRPRGCDVQARRHGPGNLRQAPSTGGPAVEADASRRGRPGRSTS